MYNSDWWHRKWSWNRKNLSYIFPFLTVSFCGTRKKNLFKKRFSALHPWCSRHENSIVGRRNMKNIWLMPHTLNFSFCSHLIHSRIVHDVLFILKTYYICGRLRIINLCLHQYSLCIFQWSISSNNLKMPPAVLCLHNFDAIDMVNRRFGKKNSLKSALFIV